MKESATYQLILEEGREEGREEGIAAMRATILRLGEKRLGPPDVTAQGRLNAISSLEQLQLIAARILEVESWTELFV